MTMGDKVLLSASRNNIQECVELALERGLGIELMAFAYPDVLDGDWQLTLSEYKEILRPLQGTLTLHGPFMDMVSGSPDPRINAVCVQRYSHAIRVAAELGAKQVVFHANFIGSLHNTFYREGWHQRNVEFWKPMAEYAAQHNVVVLLENMLVFDPTILSDSLSQVHPPYLRCCLDVGHAHLFSDNQFSFDYWLLTLDPKIT